MKRRTILLLRDGSCFDFDCILQLNWKNVSNQFLFTKPIKRKHKIYGTIRFIQIGLHFIQWIFQHPQPHIASFVSFDMPFKRLVLVVWLFVAMPLILSCKQLQKATPPLSRSRIIF